MVTRSLKIMCKIMHESRKKIICSYNRWLHHGWALFQTQNMDLHFFFGSDGSSLLRWTSIQTWIFRPNSEMLNTNVLVDEKNQMRFKDQDTFSRNKLTIKQRRSHIKHHKFRKIKKKILKWVQGSVTVVISEGAFVGMQKLLRLHYGLLAQDKESVGLQLGVANRSGWPRVSHVSPS